MPNYDVITDYNSYHGIQTTYGMPKGMDSIKNCSGCQHYKVCVPSQYKACDDENATNQVSQQD